MPEAAPSHEPAPPVGGTLVRPRPPEPWWRGPLEWVRERLPPLTARTVLGGLVSVTVLVAVAVIVVRPAVASSSGRGGRPEDSLPRATPPTTAAPDDGGGSAAGDGSDPPDGQLVVHVAGAVVDPGVHEVRQGGRVVDAVDAAGGPSDDADLDALDLAAKVTDGERIYVPHDGEVPAGAVVDGGGGGGSGGTGGDSPIDLNAASAEDLDKLPGVGPSLADAIVEYRRRHGPFQSIDQLLDVPGIGDAKLASIRSKVRI